MSQPSTPAPAADRSPRHDVGDTVAQGIKAWAIALALVVTCASLVFAAGAGTDVSEFAVIAATTFVLAASGGLAGGFLGLLFGMPREAERAPQQSNNARYVFNSNLLKVSDWVTTILVGLSLVSLRSIPGGLSAFADWVSPALGDESSSGPFGVFITAAGFTAALMLIYIWTTIPLRSHLENEAFDTERQWATLLAQIAEQKPPEVISEALKSVESGVLDRIQSDVDRTPPLLRDLVAKERTRRDIDAAPRGSRTSDAPSRDPERHE